MTRVATSKTEEGKMTRQRHPKQQAGAPATTRHEVPVSEATSHRRYPTRAQRVRCIFVFMRMMLIFFFLLSNSIAFTQVKMERESRAQKSDVPLKALAFIDSISTDISPKWFWEGIMFPTSYEAKFKFNKIRYSVEFDTLGNLEDLEMLTDYESLPQVVINEVDGSLLEVYQKSKITRTQIQWSGNELDIIKAVNNNFSFASTQLTVRYEIELKLKQEGRWRLEEWTVDSKGKIISQKKIITPRTDHLEY